MNRHKKYCCSDSAKLYENYYVQQSGGSLPSFQGAPFQKGYGIGSVLGGLFRGVLPLLKQGAKTIGKEAITSAALFANDLIDGHRPSSALQTRAKQAGTNLFQQLKRERGIKRKRSSHLHQKHIKSRRKKITGDIFD